MTSYKLYSSGTATADAAASLDVVQDGKIVGLLISGRHTAGAGGTSGRLELSFSSSSGFAANDTRSAIAQWSYSSIASVAGNYNQYYSLPDVPVSQGERLYLHHLATVAATSAEHTVFLLVMDKGDSSARRVRL